MVLTAIPDALAAGSFTDAAGGRLQEWLRRSVQQWPAPIPIGEEPPQASRECLSFAASDLYGGIVHAYRCDLNADGSVLVALPVAVRRENPVDRAAVWAIGEGAIAWITLAAVRLAAAYADEVGVRGSSILEVGITRASDGAPVEVWNHDGHAYGPAGHRVSAVRPSRRSVDLEACLSPKLGVEARPLLVELLQQFALSGSRHLDEAGVLQRRNFTGFDERIREWADAMGVPSEPPATHPT